MAIGTRTVAGGYAALAEYPEDEPEPDASAVIALQWGTLPDDGVARIRAAVGMKRRSHGRASSPPA